MKAEPSCSSVAGLCQDGALAVEHLTSLQKAALVFILMFLLEVISWVWEDVYRQQPEAERGLARFGLTADGGSSVTPVI